MSEINDFVKYLKDPNNGIGKEVSDICLESIRVTKLRQRMDKKTSSELHALRIENTALKLRLNELELPNFKERKP